MTDIVKSEVLKSLRLPKMDLELRVDGIVHCKYLKNAVVFRHDVEEGVQKRIEMFGDEKRLFLVDITQLRGVSLDARRYFASKRGAYNIKGVAFYMESDAYQEIALNYIEEHELSYPAQVFQDEDEAKSWLLNL